MLCFASAAAAFRPFRVDAMKDDPRIRILLPDLMIRVVLRILPHRRHPPPRPRIPGPRFRTPNPRIRILLPDLTIREVLRIPPHRRHPPRPRIPVAHDFFSSDSATSTASAPPADYRTAVPRTSSSYTDIIARSDYLRGSLNPATSTASAPPADSRTAVPRTSSSNRDIMAHDLRGSSDSATSTASAPPVDSRTAVPRTSSSDTDIIAHDLRGSLDSATSTASKILVILLLLR